MESATWWMPGQPGRGDACRREACRAAGRAFMEEIDMVDTTTPTHATTKPDRRLREFERFHRYLGHIRPDAGLRRGQHDRPGDVRVPAGRVLRLPEAHG